ncbi:MAG TPA: hypothetical protein EYQ64_12760 [Gemmatimonadetes bacterium]|nr:hypothetical protein [Gemmatimonadota bacterium]
MDLRMLIPIFGILLVMIPVAGLTLAMTLRFAVKPFVETLAQVLRESGSLGGDNHLQIEALSEQVESLNAEVRRLGETQRFDQALVAERTVPIDRPYG